jgi:hypothetical protein
LSPSLLWSIFACCSTLFSKPPKYIYTVKTNESDHKKTYQEYLKEKTFRTVVICFAIKNKYVFIKYTVVIYVAMCCQSLATLGCMHILMYSIFVHQSGGRVRQIARAGRAGFAGKSLHKISVLKYIYFFKTFYKI